jgi:hypothetical protein
VPIQDFDTEMVALDGQIFGDPDFDFLTITAGANNGLPSLGHTTLTNNGGGTFAVDSFFDISYRIDFQGSPGSALEGLSGSTEGDITMGVGDPPPAASTPALSETGWLLLGAVLIGTSVVALRRHRVTI